MTFCSHWRKSLEQEKTWLSDCSTLSSTVWKAFLCQSPETLNTDVIQRSDFYAEFRNCKLYNRVILFYNVLLMKLYIRYETFFAAKESRNRHAKKSLRSPVWSVLHAGFLWTYLLSKVDFGKNFPTSVTSWLIDSCLLSPSLFISLPLPLSLSFSISLPLSVGVPWGSV